jgi:hypothetical protein
MGVAYTIGNGKKCFLWHDVWVGCSSAPRMSFLVLRCWIFWLKMPVFLYDVKNICWELRSSFPLSCASSLHPSGKATLWPCCLSSNNTGFLEVTRYVYSVLTAEHKMSRKLTIQPTWCYQFHLLVIEYNRSSIFFLYISNSLMMWSMPTHNWGLRPSPRGAAWNSGVQAHGHLRSSGARLPRRDDGSALVMYGKFWWLDDTTSPTCHLVITSSVRPSTYSSTAEQQKYRTRPYSTFICEPSLLPYCLYINYAFIHF